jgi:hypothetical protein
MERIKTHLGAKLYDTYKLFKIKLKERREKPPFLPTLFS